MATQTDLLGSLTAVLTTELASLASSSGLTAGVISTVAGSSGLINNTYGGGGLGGYPLGRYTLKLAAQAGSLTAGTAVYVWFIRSDGTNTQDGSNSVIPAAMPDLILPVRAVSTAQFIEIDSFLPPGNWYVLLAQNTGQTWGATGNSLSVLPYTNQFN